MDTGRLTDRNNEMYIDRTPDLSSEPGTDNSDPQANSPGGRKKARIIPVSLRFRQESIACNSPEELFRHFTGLASFILESAYGEDKRAQYSLIGLNPVLRITAETEHRMIISGLRQYTRALMPPARDGAFSGTTPNHADCAHQDGITCLSPESGPAADSGHGHTLSGDSEAFILTGPDPVSAIHAIMDLFEYEGAAIPGYQGGLTGYFSYDLVYSIFETVTTEKPAIPFPLADFLMTSEYILCDHPAGEVYIFSLALVCDGDDAEKATALAGTRAREIYERIRDAPGDRDPRADHTGTEDTTPHDPAGGRTTSRIPAEVPNHNYSENISKEQFEDLVRKTKEYIFAGDIFQGVISRQLGCGYEGDPFLIYSALRRINPGPYMYYLDYGERQIIGSSPEMLVKVENNRVTTVPIAGTRPRGKDPDEDAGLEHELLSDEKECAEHLMLVDLARNDIGRVSEYGTVNVDEFMKIEKFSHVQHIVSTVSGTLKETFTPADAFKSCFPAGTLTGAPKIRAMQIIDELEPGRRGLYGGAVGHIGLDGKTDFAIAIRTLVCEDERLTFQTGAGIVADSDPEMEYYETERKASAVAQAIRLAYGGCFP